MRLLWGLILFVFVLVGATASTQVIIMSFALRPDSVVAFAVFAAIFVVGFVSFLRSVLK